MITKLVQKHYMKAVDVDIKGEWMPSAIFVRMQEIAEAHATAVGLGRVDLVDEHGFAWVLTRMSLRMFAYPRIGDTIQVSTWPLKPTRLTFLRQFQFHDAQGNELGRASSQWILFDINERIIRRPSVLGDYPYDPQAEALLDEPGKIRLPQDMDEGATRQVMYSEVDMNGHMNNTKYLNWICELYPSEFLRENRMESIKINYIAEPYIDQQVDVLQKETDEGRFVCGRTGDKTVFDAFVTWMR